MVVFLYQYQEEHLDIQKIGEVLIHLLYPPTYNYTVTDANTCIYTNSVIINEPNLISTTTLVSNVSCNGGSDGSVSLTISGGTPGYTEDWGNNDPNMLSVVHMTSTYLIQMDAQTPIL